jgi:hypothetical protein
MAQLKDAINSEITEKGVLFLYVHQDSTRTLQDRYRKAELRVLSRED